MSEPLQWTVPLPTPSLNETQRMHWAKRAKIADTWGLAIALQTRTMPRATGKRRLTIERRGTRMLDKDNAYGGSKQIVDIIKRLGLIIDDDAANVELEVTQTKLAKGERPHTLFTLEEI